MSDADADSVVDHLETCPDCDKSLTSLPPLQAIDGLKQRQSGGYSDEAACRDLINHLALQPPTPTDSAPSKPTLTRIRDYEVLEVLGQGGMGVVHRARHERLNKEVAIKLLADQATAHRQLVRRFEREMQAVGELDHPNIVRALDAGEIDGRHFLVMELLKGVDLSQLLKTRGPLSVADACELVRQAAIGLRYAHDKGLIHRDIKPSNLMLTRDSLGAPVVKVMDLGLALVSVGTTSELSLNGQLMGTPQFMAPEQAISSDVDNRADVYSLGATLYKLLTGSNPFGDLGTVQLLQKLTTTTPPSVATLRNDLPAEVVELTDRLLANDPNDRAITMGEVAETLQPFAAGHDLEPLFADITTCGTRVAIPQVEKETASPVVTPENGTRVSAATDPVKRGPRWFAIGVLGGLITLSVAMGFMWLKLTDGSYLEIDADPSVDVTVTLVKDGTEVDTFQVTKDNGRLWYKSGQYKIQLPADVQDKLTIEPSTFTMTRGATPVIRIRKSKEISDKVGPVVTTDATPAEEPPVEEMTAEEMLADATSVEEKSADDAGANPTVSANPAITWPSGPPDFDLLTRRAAAFEKLGQWQRATADWAQASREETDAAFQRFKSPGAVAWDLTLADGATHHPTRIEDGVIEFGTAADTDQPLQIRISQSGLQLEDSATYFLRCKMKSADGCRVYVSGVGLKRPWRRLQAGHLTAEYQDYDFTFAPDDNQDSQSKVRFSIGQATPGKVFLKDLVFMKVPAGFTMAAATAVETDVIDASRVTDPEVCFSIADLYFRDQQWQFAIDCYSNLITPQTTDVVLLARRAEAFEKLQQWDKAAADWARASRQQTDIAFQRFKAPDDKLWGQFGTKQYSGFLSFADGVVEFGKVSATKNVYDFRIGQPKLLLKNGETYRLRFQMKSPDGCSVRLQVKRGGAIDNVWVNETFQPPSEFKDYSFTFVARDIDQYASINFASGTKPGRIVMRDIVLMKITDAVSNGEGLKAADHVDSGEHESSAQTDTMPIPTAREAVERVLSKNARAVVMVEGKRITVDGTSQIPSVPFEFRGIIGKNGNQLNDDDCRYLARLSTIDQLGLVWSKVSKEGFKEFRGKGRRRIRWLSIPRALPESHSIAAMFPDLKYISPAYPEIVPFMKSIRGNSRIVALRVYRSTLPPEACENLAAMPNLIFLDATGSEFTRDELRLLSKSSSIRHVSMTLRNGLKASDLAPLADLKTLETIQVDGPSSALGKHQFAEEIKALLPGCEYITDTRKHNQIRDELAFKPSLEGTPVPDLEPDADGQTLAKWLIAQNGQIGFRLQHVSRLEDVPSTPFKVSSVLLDPYSDDHAQQLVAWVATHPDCELLILRHHRLSRSTLAAISKVQHLQSLALGEAEPLEDDELLELKNMPSLKRLDLCTERLTQQGWDHIRDMGLNELLVRAPTVPMEAMETIADIKTLKTLTLSKSPVTREMLEPLQRSSINTFSVRSSAPVDEDIGVALALIPNLQKVGFNTPSFTDVHLLGITGPPSLRFINIPPGSHKLQITAEGVREFVERHPKIELTKRAMNLLEP